MIQPERDSFVFISTSDTALARVKQAAEFVSLDPHFQASLKLFLDDDKVRPRTLLLDMRDLAPEDKNLLPKLRQLLPKTQVVGLLNSLDEKKSEWFLQHFMTPEMLNSFLLEFMLFQRVYCEFYEISPTDLFPDTIVYFNAYHFLPLNLKYLPLVHENFKLSDRKHKRVEALKSLYIFRGDSSAYVQYIEKYFDQFSVGLRKRAKSKAYQLLVEWRDLLYSYTLEMREVESVLTTRPDFSLWLNDLLNYLSSADDPWGLVFDLCHLFCFHMDWSLMEVIVASFLSRNLGEDEAERIIDLKLILSASRFRNDSILFKKWILNQEFSPEENELWSKYPEFSQSFKISPDFPKPVLEDVKIYQDQFLKRTDKVITQGRLVYSYVGEVIVAILQKAPPENYKKDELMESILVKCKSDGIMPEAWLEELRQFLRK